MRIVKCVLGQRERFEQIPGFIYCGRAFGGFEASPLANPYKVGKTMDLGLSLELYRKWLYKQLTTCPSTKERHRLQETLKGLSEESVLGCWCVDKEKAGEGTEQCHCDVIAKAWKWLKSTEYEY